MKDKFFLKISILGAIFLLSGCASNTDSGERTEPDTSVYHAIELGGEWFLNNQNENFLYYEYNPFEKEYSAAEHPLRELASLWAIARLAHFLEDDRYNALARKGLHYFEPYFAKDPENGFYYVNITPQKVDLGYSAFAILSLLEVEDYLQRDYYLKKFAEGILFQQNEDGSFRTYFFSDKDTAIDYYPGEALLALMSLYEITPDSAYPEAAEKAFPFYRDYWRANKNTAFVSWQTQANFKLYQAVDDPELKQQLAEFIFEMNDYMVEKYDKGATCADFNFSAGSVIAVYTEGMNRAYEMAKQVGDGKRADCYAEFIRESMVATRALQFTDENNFGKINHENAAIGGFLGNLNDKTMRVDRNQHAVFAMMRAVELGLVK